MATSTQDWIEELKGISVLELAERIKALEEEFGVSAAAMAIGWGVGCCVAGSAGSDAGRCTACVSRGNGAIYRCGNCR